MPAKIFTSFIWKYLERSGMQITQVAVSIVLARLLAPDDFGVLAIIMSFVLFADIIVQCGLRDGLVQKKDADASDFSTVFWMQLAFATAFYIILFFAAPIISEIYANDNITLAIRVIGITLFLGALTSVQEAYIQKHFLFKKMFLRSVFVIIPSGALGIALAYFGYGIWALIFQQLASAFLMCVFMTFMVPWKPKFVFAAKEAKKFFNYGYKIQLSSMLIVGYNSLNNLIIGKIFSPALLGFYTRGQYFPHFFVKNINESVNAVLFPALSNIQDNLEQFKQRTRMTIKCSCFIMFPLMAILASCAEPLVMFLLGEKWLPSVLFLQLFCFIFALTPFFTVNSIAINSLGRSDRYLKIETIRKVIDIIALAVALIIFKTLEAVAIAYAISSAINIFVNAHPNKKLINYGCTRQIADVFPIFVLSLICGATVFAISFLEIPTLAILALQIFIGAMLYLSLSRIVDKETYDYIFKMIREATKKS